MHSCRKITQMSTNNFNFAPFFNSSTDDYFYRMSRSPDHRLLHLRKVRGKIFRSLICPSHPGQKAGRRRGLPGDEALEDLHQFLNIAGLGPIFGAILGAAYGPVAYIWIVVGCIFMGAAHDFFSGMLSVRNDGMSLPDMVGKYLGSGVRKFLVVFSAFILIAVGVSFVTGPADLLHTLTGWDKRICLSHIRSRPALHGHSHSRRPARKGILRRPAADSRNTAGPYSTER